MECKFKNDFVVQRLFELNHVDGINEHTMTEKAVKDIKWILRLEYWEAEDLQAIRNSVVEIYSAFMETREYMTKMSAITAVIDSVIFKRNN